MTLLRERVDVIVEAGVRGVAAGDMVWDVSNWDEATWSGVDPTWVAMDGWELLAVRTKRGRAKARSRNPAGTATVVLGWTSPQGKWSFRPTSPVSLGMEMRVSCRARNQAGDPISGIIPIFRGAIRDIDDGWVPDRADPARQTFRLTCQLTDRFADVAAVDLPEQALTGAGDTTWERLDRIRALAGIPATYLRPNGASAVTHQSSNFARNLLDEMQVTVESETGDLYVDREGYLVMRERLGASSIATGYDREDDAQLTWSNMGMSGTQAATGFGTGQNLDDVVNRVTMAKAGGTAYQAPDALDEPTPSQQLYGLRTYQRFDLTCQNQADVEYAADYWLTQLENRTQLVKRLGARVDPNMADARLVEILDIELRDRHDVSWTDGQVTLGGSLHVQGIEHSITGDAWSIGVDLWAYADEGLEQVAEGWDFAQWSIDVWGAG